MLRLSLATHPDVTAFGEVFLDRNAHQEECFYYFLRERCREDPSWCIPGIERTTVLFDAYLRYLTRLGEAPTLVFDCKYEFLLGALTPGVREFNERGWLLDELARRGIKIIHLRRRNVLAAYVSSLLTIKNQVWATQDMARIRHRSALVPIDGLVETLRHRLEQIAHFDRLLDADAPLVIDYEDLFDEQGNLAASAIDRLQAYLGLDAGIDPRPPRLKIAPRLAEAIGNYTAVADTLAPSGLAYLLED